MNRTRYKVSSGKILNFIRTCLCCYVMPPILIRLPDFREESPDCHFVSSGMTQSDTLQVRTWMTTKDLSQRLNAWYKTFDLQTQDLFLKMLAASRRQRGVMWCFWRAALPKLNPVLAWMWQILRSSSPSQAWGRRLRWPQRGEREGREPRSLC